MIEYRAYLMDGLYETHKPFISADKPMSATFDPVPCGVKFSGARVWEMKDGRYSKFWDVRIGVKAELTERMCVKLDKFDYGNKYEN